MPVPTATTQRDHCEAKEHHDESRNQENFEQRERVRVMAAVSAMPGRDPCLWTQKCHFQLRMRSDALVAPGGAQ